MTLYARLDETNKVMQILDHDEKWVAFEVLYSPQFRETCVPCDDKTEVGMLWDGEKFKVPPGPTPGELAEAAKVSKLAEVQTTFFKMLHNIVVTTDTDGDFLREFASRIREALT